MLTFFRAEEFKVQTEGLFAGFFLGFCADNKHVETGLWGGAELRWLKLL